MDIAIIATCVAMALTILAFVAVPLFEATSGSTALRASGRRRLALHERKEQLYASIKELEFDHSVGKLSDDDYQRQRTVLEDQAVGILRELDQLNGYPASEQRIARIERDIAEMRSRKDLPAAAAFFCTACGAPGAESHRFCSQCGAPL